MSILSSPELLDVQTRCLFNGELVRARAVSDSFCILAFLVVHSIRKMTSNASTHKPRSKLSSWPQWTRVSSFAEPLFSPRRDWIGKARPACSVPVPSSPVASSISSSESKQNKGSSLTILFDHANCDGHLTPTGFTLVAALIISNQS